MNIQTINNGQIKYIFLDFDGTIIEIEAAFSGIWMQTLEKMGESIDKETLLAVLRSGKTAKQILPDLWPDWSTDKKNDFLIALEEVEENYPYDLTPHVRSFILEAHQQGYILFIVTSSWKAKVDNVLKRHALSQYISGYIFREDVTHHKPDPEPYLKAIAMTEDQNPAECMAIEDSPSGIRAAQAAELFCLGYRDHAVGADNDCHRDRRNHQHSHQGAALSPCPYQR